ncbi:putative GntR family transcriptional regulator [Candidatus Zixiibacteriota bacterium]|nr:putative GntR family transcriptional regulator [candidate division Zixibacteria bacterium]
MVIHSYHIVMGMAKYDRLLYVLNLLRSRKNLNAAMIARECGVTERTIYRDILSLSEANIPIFYDKGYKFASDNFLPPLNFNLDEYLTLKTVLESSPLYRGGVRRNTIKSIRSKIEACLSPAVMQEKKYLHTTPQIDIKSTSSNPALEKIYAAVETGINENRIVHLKYNSIQSGLIDRDVEPYFLIFIERAFYFVGYCHLRRALRTFRTDRIVAATLTEHKFAPRKDIDPAKYFENSWGVFSGEPIDVEIIFSGTAARIILLGKHHPNEVIQPLKGNRVRYRVTVRGMEEICRWLLGFGGEADVIGPAELRAEIHKRAEAILANFK